MYSNDQRNILLQNTAKPSTLHTASSSSVGTYYLADNPKHYEIQRSNNFTFYVKFPKDYFKGLIPQNTYAEANAENVLKLSVNETFVPHFAISNPITIKRGNNEMKFAGTPTFSSVTIKFDDFIGAGTKDVLLAWQRKCYDVETEKVGLASDYKMDAWLIEQTPDYQTVRTWKIAGCWISELSEDPYSHESADKHSISATIQYDKAYPYTNDL